MIENINSHHKLIEAKILRLKRRAKILIGIGSAIIFLSWTLQNFMHKQRQDELDKMYKNRLNISFNEINKNIFSVFKNLVDNNNKSSEESVIYAYFGYSLYASTVHYQGIMMASDDTEFRENNQKVYDGNMKDLHLWNDQKNIKALKWFAKRLGGWEHDNHQSTISGYQYRYQELKRRANTANNIHLVIYIIGALFFGLAFIIEYILLGIEAKATGLQNETIE